MEPRRAKIFYYGLLALVILLQYPLWFGPGSVVNVLKLRKEISGQQAENARLAERNRALAAEVIDLKHGYAAIEERARSELGMVKQGETFYHVIETTPPAGAGKDRAPSR